MTFGDIGWRRWYQTAHPDIARPHGTRTTVIVAGLLGLARAAIPTVVAAVLRWLGLLRGLGSMRGSGRPGRPGRPSRLRRPGGAGRRCRCGSRRAGRPWCRAWRAVGLVLPSAGCRSRTGGRPAGVRGGVGPEPFPCCGLGVLVGCGVCEAGARVGSGTRGVGSMAWVASGAVGSAVWSWSVGCGDGDLVGPGMKVSVGGFGSTVRRS